MTFNLHLASEEAREGHAVGAPDSDRAARGSTPAFLRALMLGFVATAIVLDWLFFGGAGAREAAVWVQRFAGR